MIENRNTILAVVLSGLVLIAWQYFYNVPQMEKQRAQAQIQTELAKQQPAANTTTPATAPQTNAPPAPASNGPGAAPAAAAAPVVNRETAIAATPRVKIDTPSLIGSISLKGARIDDLALVKFRDTVDPSSP